MIMRAGREKALAIRGKLWYISPCEKAMTRENNGNERNREPESTG
jgi:hypothetical protein